LKVKSDRVRSVLSYLAEQGEARIKEVRDGLAISQASMNALMQYLKRKGLVRKIRRDLSAPYELTSEGRDILREMSRRAQR
jgi:Mn-dependent DtxR family transcriptional regulator